MTARFAPLRYSFRVLLFASASLASTLAPALAAEPAAADAEPRPATARELNEAGVALYAERDYSRALEKFIQAHALAADPNLLFNIARCYEGLGEIDVAIEKYRAFLAAPGAGAAGRQRASESLEELLSVGTETRAGLGAAPPPFAGSVAPRLVDARAPEAESPPYGAWPWVGLGSSVVIAALGTTFYVLGVSDHRQVTEARGYAEPDAVIGLTRRDAEALVSSGDTKKLLGGVGLGLAGALAAGSVALLVLRAEHDGGADGPALAVSLLPAIGGAAASVGGTF